MGGGALPFPLPLSMLMGVARQLNESVPIRAAALRRQEPPANDVGADARDLS